MKTKINIKQLRDLVLNGISSEELNSRYDYSHITDMGHMFYGSSSLETIPKLDTSNVINMNSMFYNCSSLESIPELDTRNVIDMRSMFNGCSNLKDIDLYKYLSSNIKSIDSKFLKEKYPELYI